MSRTAQVESDMDWIGAWTQVEGLLDMVGSELYKSQEWKFVISSKAGTMRYALGLSLQLTKPRS